MNTSETIKVAIDFVSKQVDPGGGGTVTPAAQTGDIAIWAIMAILFVGVIAYCMFKLSRVFNSEYTSSSTSAKHAKNAIGLGRFATIKAVLIVAIVGLIACLSITTTTAIAKNANNGIVTIPDKIQIAIDEETGQPDPVSFQFFNDSLDYAYFTKSNVVLSSEAQSVSSAEEWNLTLNTLGTCIFTGNPSGEEYAINDTKVFEPLQKSDSTLSYGLFNYEAAKALIGKKAFEVTLTCSTDVAFAPEAVTGLIYNESVQTGVPEGDNYSITGNKQTIPGSYTATASLTDPTNFVWEDGTKTDKQIPWSIAEAPVNVPVAKTGLVYQPSTEQIGVENGKGYSLTNNRETNAGDYTAIAKLDQYYVWSDASHDVKEIPWSIAKATGGFSEVPTPINPIYSAADQELVTPGSQKGDGEIVYKIKGISDQYTTEIPKSTNAGSYTVLAHVLEGQNYTESEDVEIQNATIQKAKIEKITIHGEKVDYDYVARKHYIFPDYANEEVAYTASCVMRSGDPYVFKDSYINPKPNDGDKIKPIEIISATEDDIKTHYLGLININFTYTDRNVDVEDTEWINEDDACMTINKKTDVDMNVTPTTAVPGQVQIGETVSYSVSIENISEEDISGASLYFGVDKKFDNISIAKGETYTISSPITYTVTPSDFDYPPTMDKYFTFTFGDETPYYKYVVNKLTLSYKSVTWSPPQPINYDGNPHSFPTSEGYTIIFGGDAQTNAGTYYTFAMLNPGYHWTDWDQYQYEYRFSAWTINKINLDVHFQMPQGKNNFEATFGDDWKVSEQEIVGTTSTGQAPPDSLNTILGGDPSGLTTYEQYSDVGTYEVKVSLPPSSGWNLNYNITKDDTYLIVSKKDITIIWPTAKVFKYTGEVIDIEFSIEGSLSKRPATVSYTTYADQARTTPKPFKDTGSYYVSAHLSTDKHDPTNYKNYKITEGDQPSEVFEIKNTLNKWPKAVLRVDYNLMFIYDDVTYKPDEYFILKVYEVTNTSYNGGSSDKIDPQWYQDADTIKKVTIMPNFVNCSICSDGTTALTSMDSWFANMQNLEKIDGLENIHAGITSLNATFMNTKLNDYTFAKDFFNCVTSTHSMFKDCSSIEEIGVLDWTYANFTNTTSMFEGCSSLKHIYCLSNTNWSEVVDLKDSSTNMFKNCNLLHNHSTLTEDNITYAREDTESNPGFFEYPSHDNLFEYTIGELKVVSDYLVKYYIEKPQDPICLKFTGFRDNGILASDEAGADNGKPIYSDFTKKNLNTNANNHWAIDSAGRIASDPDFANDDNTTIQARIIGICEDVDEYNKPIGLTFMTTHALKSQSFYEADVTSNYGWSGDSTSGSCTLRTFLTDSGDTLFPSSLKSVVKTAQKCYKYSSTLGSGTANDKFWAPSMIEIYGECSSDVWPNDNEGSQYKAFLNKISASSYGSLTGIDSYQSGSDRTLRVWSRSLEKGDAGGACVVDGYNDGWPNGFDVFSGNGVVSCFCI